MLTITPFPQHQELEGQWRSKSEVAAYWGNIQHAHGALDRHGRGKGEERVALEVRCVRVTVRGSSKVMCEREREREREDIDNKLTHLYMRIIACVWIHVCVCVCLCLCLSECVCLKVREVVRVSGRCTLNIGEGHFNLEQWRACLLHASQSSVHPSIICTNLQCDCVHSQTLTHDVSIASVLWRMSLKRHS